MKSSARGTLQARINRRVRLELRAVRCALADRRHPHRAVHEARKAIRRLRALLALAVRRLEAIEVVDRELRRLGDSLSRLRDAQVALETAEAIASQEPASAQNVVHWLAERRDHMLERALRRDPDFARRQMLLDACTRALETVAWSELEDDDLHEALRHSRKRLKKAERKAERDPSPEHLHRLRRRARRLRMQLELLRTLVPDFHPETLHGETPGKAIRILHKQSNRLGQRQDKEHLADVLERMPMTFEREVMRRRIERELKEPR